MSHISRHEKIILACQLAYGGLDYIQVAEEIGVSKSSITNYSRTDIWAQELNRLKKQTGKSSDRIAPAYQEKLEKTMQLLQASGTAGLESSTRLLQKIRQIESRIDPDEFDDPYKRVHVYSQLSRAYSQLSEASYNFLDKAYGLTEILERLRQEKEN